MFKFIVIIFRIVFLMITTRHMDIVIKNAILKKENEILKRKNKERIKFKFFDRLFYAVMCKLSEKTKEFVRQQIVEFAYDLKDMVCLIHDRTGEFWLQYNDYGINGIKTSVKAPNMNSIAERFIGSVRREILDHFIIFGQNQLYNILREYVAYYNTKRPHQGIEQRVPKGYTIKDFGRIKSKPTLFGLNCEYYREAA